VQEQPTPYDRDLQRLSEILGALHFLRGICTSNEGQKWRSEAQTLIDAEAPSGTRREQMIGSFNRGYRVCDLSLVYPLPRGSGPLLTTIAASVLLRERPSPVALLGVFLIVGSAIVLTGNPRRLLLAGAGHAVAFALMTGALIAAYTLVDKEAVSAVLIPPLIYNWAISLGSWAFLTPWVMTRREEVSKLWRIYRREAIAIGILAPLAYLLVLSALVFSPVG